MKLTPEKSFEEMSPTERREAALWAMGMEIARRLTKVMEALREVRELTGKRPDAVITLDRPSFEALKWAYPDGSPETIDWSGHGLIIRCRS